MVLVIRRVTRLNYFRLLLLVLTILSIVSLFFITQNVVKASHLSWAGEDKPSVVSATEAPVESSDCLLRQNMKVVGEEEAKNICLGERGVVQLGTYYESGSSYLPVVRFQYDTNMYKLRGVCGGYKTCLYLPGKDMLVAKQNLINGLVQSLVIYKDFSSRLKRVANESSLQTEYQFNSSNPDYVFKNTETDYAWPVGGVGISDNEEWLAFEARERAVMLLSTDDFSIKRVSVQNYRYGVGSDPSMEFDVSDDGQYLAMMGKNTASLVFDISDTCGDVPSNDEMQDNRPIANPCPNYDIFTHSDDFIERYSEGYAPRFDIDGGELTFYATSYSSPSKLVTLRASGYQPRTLDYLALGDSYSSGEGDTATNSEGKKYYLAYTDNEGDYENNIPREKCHQSLRAWPFILSDSSGIDQEKQETVACSGATIGDIAGGSKTYEGQGDGTSGNKPRLQDLSNISNLQLSALEEFTPGRIKQIDFVKKYKPKTITVTAGGNDAQFEKIINACVNPAAQIINTCTYAATDAGKSTLGKAIKNQYERLKKIYSDLYDASGKTSKIYAVGYTQFVNNQPEDNMCRSNVRLSKLERNMAVEGVKYINQVIEDAAQAAGVKYIKIEDSLKNHQLCDEGSKYVTGIAAWAQSELQESFHPNKMGQERIASKIKSELDNETLLEYNNCDNAEKICPDTSSSQRPPTSYFATAMAGNPREVSVAELFVNEAIDNGVRSMKLFASSLEPNSTVAVEIQSQPTSLGSYTVNQNGELVIDTVIPSSIMPGFHTLRIYGKSFSGEPLELFQVVQVQGPEGDIDGDGIPDISDPCLFIESANSDVDFDGTDDACDPSIDIPYQVRNGDATKGENANYLYLERNIDTGNVTGVDDDYDPDNDGWAIVAASTSPADSGKPAHSWIDSTKKPHVSLRTSYNGCMQFTPQSLAKVEAGQTRAFTQEAANTNTCRSESPNADVDGNGTPDNQQPLYRARNGLTTNGENTTTIYLERSRPAAEAQLGLSDYLPDEGASLWSQVAISQNLLSRGAYKKLIFVNNQPVVLFANALGLCLALTPENVNVVTHTSYFSRGYSLGLVPQGQYCN